MAPAMCGQGKKTLRSNWRPPAPGSAGCRSSQAYTRLDRFDLALECTERASPILGETGDREGCLVASLNSGIAFTWKHKFDQAERRYHRALALAEELGMSALRLGSAPLLQHFLSR